MSKNVHYSSWLDVAAILLNETEPLTNNINFILCSKYCIIYIRITLYVRVMNDLILEFLERREN